MTKKEKKELKQLKTAVDKSLVKLYKLEDTLSAAFDDVDTSVAMLEDFIDGLLKIQTQEST